MKKLFSSSVVLLFSVLLLNISCNKDEESQSTNQSTKINAHLKSFYNKEFRFGKVVESEVLKNSNAETSRTAEYEGIKLEEVFVGEETRARGYVVTDKITGEFLYFVDVDRANYKLTAIDITDNQTITKENVNLLQEWAESNGLDMIKLIEEYNAEINSGTQERRRFWGWTGWTNVGGCDEGWQTQVNVHYILGIRNAVEYKEIPC